MTEFTITIQNADVPIFLASFGYQAQIDGAPNPESPQDFLKKVIKGFAEGRATEYLKKQALLALNSNPPVGPVVVVD